MLTIWDRWTRMCRDSLSRAVDQEEQAFWVYAQNVIQGYEDITYSDTVVLQSPRFRPTTTLHGTPIEDGPTL